MVGEVRPDGVAVDVVRVRIEVAAPVITAGLKLPVVFVGNPLAFRVMAPVKPGLCRLDTVYVVESPFTTDSASGEANSKNGAEVTSRLTDVVSVRLPLVPVRVIVKFPGVEHAGTLMVAEPAPPPIEAGLKTTGPHPMGIPLALRSMLPLKPLKLEAEIVYVAVPPGTTSCVAGVPESEKPGSVSGTKENMNVP